MLVSKLAAMAAEVVPPEFVETITSSRGLGSVAGVVLVVFAYLFFKRRGADQDLQLHEATKRELIVKLGDVALEVLRRTPDPDRKKDNAP